MMAGDALVELQELIQGNEVKSMDVYVEGIANLLRHTKFNFNTELQLHLGLEMVMAYAGLAVTREVVLGPGDRIDFWTMVRSHRIGIEVKIKQSTASVVAQLERYAKTGKVDALILVTSRSKHRSVNGRLLPGAGANFIPVTTARLPWVR